ncbi:MAG: hypothetical protein A2033_12855 [Bacteroidetes bacterium GWA2_31_9]|nr:MAG: hypothetical protein A2033_12855 [Bacteroidetes bacterium GWA2_31_9]
MFYLRLNKVRILNNRELLGKGEIQIMSFVTLGEADFPNFNEFFKTNDEKRKREIIENAVDKVINSRVLPEIGKVKDNQVITFGDTGLIVYKADNIPPDFNWMLIAIESDKKTRDNAELISKILTDKNITSIVGVISALATVSNPVAAAIATLSTLISKSLTTIFKKDKDDEAGLFLASFIEKEHYPNGKREKEDVIDSTGNMYVDYTIFGYK